MIAFFVEVTIFGQCIAALDCIRKGKIMSFALTFSGALFLSIALIDIIPDAIYYFDLYYAMNPSATIQPFSIGKKSSLPLTMTIVLLTFMAIMLIDKILIGNTTTNVEINS